MKCIQLKQTDSTNLYIERHMDELPSPCSVRADIQTAGIGRLSRDWNSASGGLWFSILFKNPTLKPYQLQKVCSLSTLEILNKRVPKEAFALKWPNDIYYHSKKISGCLQKNLFSRNHLNCIIGIGVNINNLLPEELQEKAISLKTITGKKINVQNIYNDIINNIGQRLFHFSQRELEREYKKHQLIQPGLCVNVFDVINQRYHTGIVLNVPDETLEIQTDNEKRFSFKAADVTLKAWKH